MSDVKNIANDQQNRIINIISDPNQLKTILFKNYKDVCIKCKINPNLDSAMKWFSNKISCTIVLTLSSYPYPY